MVACTWWTYAAFCPNYLIATKIHPPCTWCTWCTILTTNPPLFDLAWWQWHIALIALPHADQKQNGSCLATRKHACLWLAHKFKGVPLAHCLGGGRPPFIMCLSMETFIDWPHHCTSICLACTLLFSQPYSHVKSHLEIAFWTGEHFSRYGVVLLISNLKALTWAIQHTCTFNITF